MRKLLALLLALACAAQAQVSLVSPLLQAFSGVPGQTLRGAVQLENDGERPAQVRLSRSDYEFSVADGRQFSAPATHPRSNANWLSFGAEIVTVPAKSRLSVPYQLRVPERPGLPGSYWSVLMVEPLAADDVLLSQSAPNGLVVKQATRYAVQLVTTLPDGAPAHVNFKNPALGRDANGQPTLQVDLENDGERHVLLDVYAEVYAGERLVGRVNGNVKHLYPGSSARDRWTFSGLGAGEYRVVVVADGGNDQVFGVRYDLTLP